jgi:hypothetical protein
MERAGERVRNQPNKMSLSSSSAAWSLPATSIGDGGRGGAWKGLFERRKGDAARLAPGE